MVLLNAWNFPDFYFVLSAGWFVINNVFWLMKYLLQPKFCEPRKYFVSRAIQESGINLVELGKEQSI